jgi:hypothetical protein
MWRCNSSVAQPVMRAVSGTLLGSNRTTDAFSLDHNVGNTVASEEFGICCIALQDVLRQPFVFQSRRNFEWDRLSQLEALGELNYPIR